VCLPVLLLTLTVTACGKSVAGEPRAVAQTVVRTTSTTTTRTTTTKTTTTTTTTGKPSTSDILEGLAGIWEGEYTCGQGNTGLKLTIRPPKTGLGSITTFEFFPSPSNSSVPRGSYTMLGDISPSGQLVFRQQVWLEQPPGYVMVDLKVTSPLSPSAKLLSGDVLMDNCKGFSVRRS